MEHTAEDIKWPTASVDLQLIPVNGTMQVYNTPSLEVVISELSLRLLNRIDCPSLSSATVQKY